MLFILYKSLRIAPKNFIFMAACCSDASNGQESTASSVSKLVDQCPSLIRKGSERDLVKYPFCCYHGLFRSKKAFQNNIFNFFYILFLGNYYCHIFFGKYNSLSIRLYGSQPKIIFSAKLPHQFIQQQYVLL